MGGGHIPSWVVEHVEALARQMPVVMAARIQSGYLLKSTYERPGSEIDLMRRGVTFAGRSEEHTSELQSLMRISYAVFCLKKKKKNKNKNNIAQQHHYIQTLS